jgi:hypothetical protein
MVGNFDDADVSLVGRLFMVAFYSLSDFRSLLLRQEGEAGKDEFGKPLSAVSFVSFPLAPKSPLPELADVMCQPCYRN